MINLAPSDREKLSTSIEAVINPALQAENKRTHERRSYLGASRLGEECWRQLYFEHHAPEKHAGFEGRILRRFRMGHMHEQETGDWLCLAGFDLRRPSKDEGVFEFFTEDKKLGGHCDGVILGGPIDMPWPILWEHKIMKSDIWRAAFMGGIEIEQPTYYGQCVIYDFQLGLNGALFTALNTDTSELMFEFIAPNHGKARELMAKGRTIVDAKSENDVPRVALSETDYRCRMCDFEKHCWRPDDRVAKPIPSVLPSWARK